MNRQDNFGILQDFYANFGRIGMILALAIHFGKHELGWTLLFMLYFLNLQDFTRTKPNEKAVGNSLYRG